MHVRGKGTTKFVHQVIYMYTCSLVLLVDVCNRLYAQRVHAWAVKHSDSNKMAAMALNLANTESESEMAMCVIKPVQAGAKKAADSSSIIKELKVQVSIQEQESRRPVCCKSDGARFGQGDTTVKLRRDNTYIISITCAPAIKLSTMRAELKHRLAETPGGEVTCCCFPSSRNTAYMEMGALEWSDPQQLGVSERSAASGAGKSTFELAWSCDMDLTKSGMRGEVALDIAVRDFGVVTLPILAKVYGYSDNAAAHGVSLASIAYTLGRSGLTGEVKSYSTVYNK